MKAIKIQNALRFGNLMKNLCAAALLILAGNGAKASIAYGTLNNFDTVNDTSNVCHGFEIELDDCRSADITFCYSYNHYGTPNIREDTLSVPGHTNCFVRYAAVFSNGVWSAYTAIPTGPIAPTGGHAFTNPGTNFGGEHFGVGYYGSPSALKYNWLLDDGTGHLVHGPPVLVSTPIFTYYPPAPGGIAQVQAAVEAPQVENEPVEGFGPAAWVKSIRTANHTNQVIELRNLMSDDPDFPNDKSWRNGETSEVETEFELLQQEFGSSGGHGGGGGGGGGGSLSVTNAPEVLTNGDEIITRRYEFYAYVGPTDPATHEALAKDVGPDGIHGINEYSNTVVVGDYLGAQMSAFKNELPIGLTENIADGTVNSPYPTRSIVIAGVPFSCTNSGNLPNGMTLDLTTGELSGTPSEAGVFTFTVRVSETNHQASVEHVYTFAITEPGQVLPAHSTIDTVAYPLDSGDISGLGLYTNGNSCTVVATPRSGYRFSKWTDNDATVSTNAAYTFPVTLNRSLVANFVLAPAAPEVHFESFTADSHTVAWPTNATGYVLQFNTNLGSPNWTVVNTPVVVAGTNATVTLPTQPGATFYRLKLQ